MTAVFIVCIRPPGFHVHLMQSSYELVHRNFHYFQFPSVSGLSIFLAPIIILIPIPIFFGVLLHLGILSLSGPQMVERFVMMFMPRKHHPDVGYVRKVGISGPSGFILMTRLPVTQVDSTVFPVSFFCSCRIR